MTEAASGTGIPDAAGPIEAAGAVLWRTDDSDGRCYAIIHRPKYDDWTLPKGKLDVGESHRQAAIREVWEETGWHTEVGEALGEIRYDHRGRHKRVMYWAMRALHGRFSPNREVDELRWLPLAPARELLTYARDREILDRFAGGLADT